MQQAHTDTHTDIETRKCMKDGWIGGEGEAGGECGWEISELENRFD